MSQGCRDFRERLPDYQEGGLPGDEREALVRHLAECSLCRSEEAQLRRTWEMLEAWSDLEPSEDLVPAILQRVKSEVRPCSLVFRPSPRTRDWIRLGRWAAAAAVLLLVSLFVLSNTSSVRRDAPVIEDMVSSWDAGQSVEIIDQMPHYVALDREHQVPGAFFEPDDPRHRVPDDDMLEEIIIDQNG
jgi:anti-sigma factor RsiW